MCKVLRVYQQTFIQNNNAKSSGRFQFMRIMKDNHLQKFRIKVLGISDLNAQGGTLFMKNYPIFNMKCNTQTDLHTTGAVDTSNNLFYYTGTGNNDFYLGTLNQALYTQPEMMVEELSLTEFTIERSVVGGFIVSLQVELLE